MLSKLQIDLFLAALSALLPLVPAEHRARAGDILDAVRDAASLGGDVAKLADAFTDLRREIDAMSGRSVSVADMDKALTRLRAASAVFRAALESAAPSTS